MPANIREEMLDTMSLMLAPARKILGMTRGQLSRLSGIPEGAISDAEDGISPLKPEHYLALSAALGTSGAGQGSVIHNAITRLMTPEGRTSPDSDDGFAMARKWLEAADDEDTGGDVAGTDVRLLSDSELEAVAKGCRIIAGMSAVEDENFPALVSRLQPWLKSCGGMVCVPSGIVDGLRDTLDDTEDDDEEILVSDTLDRIERFQREGLVDVFGSYDEGSTVAEIIGARHDGRGIILITQDADEASSMAGGNVRAARITDTGDLELWG